MSLPQFPEVVPPITRDDAINQVISSIAFEELGLSHIINAEGEKIQYVLGTLKGVSGPAEPVGIDDLIKINESVQLMLDKTAENNQALTEKLSVVLSPEGGKTGATGATGTVQV